MAPYLLALGFFVAVFLASVGVEWWLDRRWVGRLRTTEGEMLTVTNILNALWRDLSSQEEAEAKTWMIDTLGMEKFIFDDESEVRQWALHHTDLVEPEEEEVRT